MASPWKEVGGGWRLGGPAGPIRLVAPWRGESCLVLRRESPPRFKLSVVVTVESVDARAPEAAALVFPRGRGRSHLVLRADPARRSIVLETASAAGAGTMSASAVGARAEALRIGEPLLVEIVSSQ